MVQACFVFFIHRNNRFTTEGAVLIGKGLSLNESLQVLKVIMRLNSIRMRGRKEGRKERKKERKKEKKKRKERKKAGAKQERKTPLNHYNSY